MRSIVPVFHSPLRYKRQGEVYAGGHRPRCIMSLLCRVCGKEFPEFDQRGFRNAGFTAHQNRCIEREQQPTTPSSSSSPPRQRWLLPAPTTTTTTASHLPQWTFRPPSPPSTMRRRSRRLSSQRVFPLRRSHPSLRTRPRQPHSQPEQENQRCRASSLPTPYELLAASQQQRPVDSVDPVQSCDYCTPQAGLHDPSCTLLQFTLVFGRRDWPTPSNSSPTTNIQMPPTSHP